jgi:hypothetical protein
LYHSAARDCSDDQRRTTTHKCNLALAPVFFDAFLNENQFWRARIKKCMNQKKIGHIRFKKKNAFRSVKKSREKVEHERLRIFYRSGICTGRLNKSDTSIGISSSTQIGIGSSTSIGISSSKDAFLCNRNKFDNPIWNKFVTFFC